MRTWKRILTLTLLVFLSIFTTVACSDDNKYANMQIEVASEGLVDNTIKYSYIDDSKNVFSLKVKVTGVGRDVSKSVMFEVDNPSIVTFDSFTEDDGVTTANFKVNSDGGLAVIKITTEEGNVSTEFPVTVNIPVQMIEVKNNLIPLVRGEETTLDDSDKYLEYTPANTSEREVTYFAEAIEGDGSDVAAVNEINEHIAQYNTLLVPSDSKIKHFYLSINSTANQDGVANTNLFKKTIVNVFDAPNLDSIIIEEESHKEGAYPLLSRDNVTGEYTLMLSSGTYSSSIEGDDTIFNYNSARLMVASMQDANVDAIENFKETYIRYDNNGELVTVEVQKFSLSVKNLDVESNAVLSDTKLVSVSRVDNSTYEVSRNSTTHGEYKLKFEINFKGYEDIFEPKIVTVNVQTVQFPKQIKLFSNRIDMEQAQKPNATELEKTGLQDGDIVLYSNGDNTIVFVDVWSDNESLTHTDSSIKQEVIVECNNPNVEVLGADGAPLLDNTMPGGSLIYLRKVTGTEITGDIVLKFTSKLFKEVTREVRVTYISENTTISIKNNKVQLDSINYDNYDPEINHINLNKTVDLIVEGYLTFTGLPLNEAGNNYDYSSVKVEVEDTTIAEYVYNSETNSMLLNIKNKIGNTRIRVSTQNGIVANFDNENLLIVYYPITLAETFGIQIDHFETKDTVDYKYKFMASNQTDTDSIKTKLLVGESYTFYYLLNGRGYSTLDGIMTLNRIVSSNPNAVDVTGRLIEVKDYSPVNVLLTLVYSPIVPVDGLDNVYIKVEVELERMVTSISTDKPSYTIYDSSRINEYAYIMDTDKKYYDEYAIKTINVRLNPEDATTLRGIEWAIVYNNYVYNPSSINGKVYSYLISDEAELVLTVSNDDRTATIYGSFTGSSEWSILNFRVQATVKQSYTSSLGVEINSNTLNLAVDVTLKKVIKVESINANIYNYLINFDQRDLETDAQGLFNKNNTYEFTYSLNTGNIQDNPKDILTKEISIITPSNDIEYTINGDKITFKYVKMSAGYEEHPEYFVYIVANDSQVSDGPIDVRNIGNSYSVYVKITIRIANGKSIPYQVGSIDELIEIGESEESLSANYVLIRNIYLDGYNWTPIGTMDRPFKGSFSGRYVIEDGIYQDYNIYNLNINVDNSETTLRDVSVINYGLFGVIDRNATISYVNVYNYSINIKSYNTLIGTSVLEENVGVIAGINNGKIINSKVDDGIFNGVFMGSVINLNKSHAKGIKFDTHQGFNNLVHIVNVGGVVGNNSGVIQEVTARTFISTNDHARSGKYVRVGGVAGINGGTITNPSSSNFAVTSGIEGFDVVVAINPKQDINQISTKAFMGGVTGVNHTGAGVINTLSVRCFIFGKDNVGGVAGRNMNEIQNTIVVPNVIAQNNVGGLIGENTNSVISGDLFGNTTRTLVRSNKVQFLDFSDEWSYFNTAIYGNNNVGGLIGKNIANYSKINNDVDVTKVDFVSLSSIVSYNSVASYYNRDIIHQNNYSTINRNNRYYGDIVLSYGANQSASGFIGSANNVFIDSAYVKANIVFTATNSTYIGGVVGTIGTKEDANDGIATIFNTTVFGCVYNLSDNVTALAGSFFGNATNINSFINSSKLSTDSNYVEVSDTISHSNINFSNYDPSNLEDIDMLTFVDFVKLNAATLSMTYGNIISSYSTLKVNENNETKYIENFASVGETRDIVASNGQEILGTGSMPFRLVVNYNGTKYSAKALKITNLMIYNSFYVGYTPDMADLGGNTINFGTITYEDVTKSHDTTKGGSLYGYSADGVPVTKFFNPITIELVEAMSATNNASAEVKVVQSLNNVIDTTIYYNNGVNNYLNLYVWKGESNTGLNDNSIPKNYYRYYNPDVLDGCPIPFSFNRFYTTANSSLIYVDLIINLAPTIIEAEDKVAGGDDYYKGSAEDKVSETIYNITPKTATIKYYAINYNSSRYSTQIMNVYGEQVNVIDLNNDRVFSNLDINYSKFLYDTLETENLYRLKDIIDIKILPPYVQNGLINYESTNERIATIEIINDEIYIRATGTGRVQFEISSAYNTDVPVTFSLNVVSAVNQFKLFADMGRTQEIDNNISVLKNEYRSTPVYAKVTSSIPSSIVNNQAFKNYCKVNLEFESKDTYGVRYFLVNNNSIYFEDDYGLHLDKVKLNGKTFNKLTYDAKYNHGSKYSYFVDGGLELNITGIEIVSDFKLLAVPYVDNGTERIYLFDLYNDNPLDVNGKVNGEGCADIITLNIVNGTYSVKATSTSECRPLNAQDIAVYVETDDPENILTLKVDGFNSFILDGSDVGNRLDFSCTANQVNLMFKFGKMYIILTSVGKMENKPGFVYYFRLGVDEAYLFDDDLLRNYNLEFTSDGIVDVFKTEVMKQTIDNSMVRHYANIDQEIANQEIYERKDYYESYSLISGYPGLLHINLFPKYASVDYIEIVSSDESGFYISMEQMLAVNNATNESFLGYYKVYSDARNITHDGRGLIVRKYSSTYTDGDGNEHIDYDGTYYVKTIVPTIPVGSIDFTLTYTAYLNGEAIYTGSTVINVTKSPSVTLSINGQDTGIVALGKDIDISAVADGEIEWSVISNNESEVRSLENIATTKTPIRINDSLYKVEVKKIKDLGVSWQEYIGKTITLKATITVDIKGRIYKASDTITIRFALFTIDSVTIKHVEDGMFTGYYNQEYDMKATINCSYDEEYDTLSNGYISKLIKQESDGLSQVIEVTDASGDKTYKSKIFHVYKNKNELKTLEVGQYDDFVVGLQGSYLTFKNNQKYPTSTLCVRFDVDYVSVRTSQSGIVINPRVVTGYCTTISEDFGMNFIRLSNEESPEPIYTKEELMNMEEGGYYILLNDIVLDEWVPLDVAIASLDGNGYVLTLESFYDTTLVLEEGDEADTELNLGVFSKIYAETTIKNLIIEVKTNNTSEHKLLQPDGSEVDAGTRKYLVDNLNIDAKNYTNVQFGVLAGINEGIVTNTIVINDANKYRNDRNKLLESRGIIGSYTILEEPNVNSLNKFTVINIDYGEISTNAVQNKIGGFVGINNGYITNSNIENISLIGLDCVAGFVAENNKIISSSYFMGGNVQAAVSAEDSDELGVSAFVFTNNGTIAYSYASGMNSKYNLTGIDNITSFAGVAEYQNKPLRAFSTGVVTENGNASGFVYFNNGKITDSYSNILVSGAESTSFVYSNSGSINNVYTTSIVTEQVASSYPFISLIENYTKPNNSGTITNAYYLKMLNNDLDSSNSSVAIDLFLNETLQVATAISAKKFESYSTFGSFAFNSNYDSSSDTTYLYSNAKDPDKTDGIIDENYNEQTVTLKPIDQVTRAVWFYPTSNVTDGSAYFRKTSYTYGLPQLVSANLYTYSLKYYLSDDKNVLIESIYSSLLEMEDLGLNITRNSINPTFVETKLELIASEVKKDTETVESVSARIISEMKNYDELINEYITYKDEMGELSDAERITLQNKANIYSTLNYVADTMRHVVVNVYLTQQDYEKVDSADNESPEAIKRKTIINNITKYILVGQTSYSGYCYIEVKLNGPKTEEDATTSSNIYEYTAILEKEVAGGKSISLEYGNSIINPYIVKNANDFNVFILQINENLESTNSSNLSNKYLRFVKDITFDDSELTAKTFNTIYSGVLDGNGMSITNLRLNADTTISSSAINKQIDAKYLEAETYVIGNDGTNDITRNATSLGMFAKLINGATVKNLSVNIEELYATGVNFVGTVAGQVIDSNLFNIEVTSTAIDPVFGGNIVGGVAGRVSGDSSLINLTSGASVTANYNINTNNFSKDYMYINKAEDYLSKFNVYIPTQYDIDTGEFKESSNFNEVSISGGIVGVVDLRAVDASSSAVDVTTLGRVRNAKLSGEVTIIGETVGGLFGYVGPNTNVNTSYIKVSEDSQLKGSRIVGGLVGMNVGTINRSFVANDDETQKTVDNTLSTLTSETTQIYNNENTGITTFFGGNAHFTGGLVGLNMGNIQNSYNRLDVVNINSMYAGGLIGVAVGGSLKIAYTTADVYAFKGIGGLIGYNAPNFESRSMLINNVEQSKSSYDFSTSLNMSSVVALNIWSLEHLNVRRSYINPYAVDNAYIGSIIGYSDIKTGNDIKVDDIIPTRLQKENMYTITAYTYNSILEYENLGSDDTFNKFVLLNEVGNKTTTLSLEQRVQNDSDKENASDLLVSATNKYSIKRKGFKTSAGDILYSGSYIPYKDNPAQSGTFIPDENKDVTHFSRLMKYSSSRTLFELLNRVYNKDEATSTLRKIAGSYYDLDSKTISSDYIDNKMESIIVNSKTAKLQPIYPSDSWSSLIWNAVAINSKNEKADNFIFPAHVSKVSQLEILVYSYEDLLKVNQFTDGTFKLMNDIVVGYDNEGNYTKPSPLASLGNPFTGTLEGNGKTITFADKFESNGSLGLFSAIKGAKLNNFNVVVKNQMMLNSTNDSSAGGVLFGYGYSSGYTPNTITNIDITFDYDGGFPDNQKGICVGGSDSNLISAAAVGIVGGSCESLIAENINVSGEPNIQIIGKTSPTMNASLFYGGLFGYASMYSLGSSSGLTIDNLKLYIELYLQEGEYENIAIGGAFGKLTNTYSSSDDETKNKLTTVIITNPTMKISLKNNTESNVYFQTIGIGGAFGLLQGISQAKKFDISTIHLGDPNDEDKSTWGTLNVESKNISVSSIYSSAGNYSVGGLVGEIGGNGDGYLNLEDLMSHFNNLSFTHSNAYTYALTNARSNADMNLSSTIGSVLAFSGELRGFISKGDLKYSIEETDAVTINIGGTFGKLNGGIVSQMVSSSNLETSGTNSISMSEYTSLNAGGIVGKMTDGIIKQSANKGNINFTIKITSTNEPVDVNANIGGLIGYADVINSSSDIVSECYSDGIIKLSLPYSSKKYNNTSNIGGLVGFIDNNLTISDSFSATIISTYTYDGDNNIVGSNYNSIGGVIGAIKVSTNLNSKFKLNNVYSIADINVILIDDGISGIGGIVGKATSTAGYDVSSSLLIENAYYLADFMLQTNALGKALSVEEMLFDSEEFNTPFKNSVKWTVVEESGKYGYPQLSWTLTDNIYKSTKLVCEIITDLQSSQTFASGKSYIITDKDISGLSLKIPINTDIYFMYSDDDTVSLGSVFGTIDNGARVFGLRSTSNISTAIINVNNGKVARSTFTNGLSTYYIKTLSVMGADINPTINGLTTNLYNTFNGQSFYANIINADNINFSGDVTSKGIVRYAKFTTANNKTNESKGNVMIYDSYITLNSNEIVYYLSDGSTMSLTKENSKDLTKFTQGFNFETTWIKLDSLNEGQVSLRWELKNKIDKQWFFEDINIYSPVQTAYHEYVWNNYINKLVAEGKESTITGFTVVGDTIIISTPEALAYYSKLVNEYKSSGNKMYAQYHVSLGDNINLQGKLFTPIGGAKILEYDSKNQFNGSFDGKGKTISNMFIICSGNSGLFGDSFGSSFVDVIFDNAQIIATSGNAGTLIGKHSSSVTIDKVHVINSSLINNDISGATVSVGGIVGLFEVANVGMANSSVKDSKIYNAVIGGGIVGYINNSTRLRAEFLINEAEVSGTKVGGILGESKATEIYIMYTYNLGNIKGVGNESYAGGLVGKTSEKITIQCSYNASYVNAEIYAAGLIASADRDVIITDVFVSRGDIGAQINTETNNKDNINNVCITVNDATNGKASAFVNSKSGSVKITDSYSSLKDLTLVNSYVTVTYDNVYKIANTTGTNNDNTVIKTISSADLSANSNMIFTSWGYTWGRIAKRNNLYPVIIALIGFWDTETPTIVGNNIEIKTPKELAWLANQTNANASYNGFKDYTITLMNDIDMGGYLTNPIGYSKDYSFRGTFNFNSNNFNTKAITNLSNYGYYSGAKITEDVSVSNVGLFGYTDGATFVGNLILGVATEDQSQVVGRGNNVGALIGYSKNTMMTDCTITNYINTYCLGDYVGGIIGYAVYDDARSYTGITLINNANSVKGNASATSSWVAGVIGGINAVNSVGFKNLTNTATISLCKDGSGGLIGEIKGSASITIGNGHNESDIVGTISSTYLGGLVGAALDSTQLSISSSTMYGKVAGSNTRTFIGGLVGYANSLHLATAVVLGEDFLVYSKNGANELNNVGATGGLVGYVHNTLTLSITNTDELNGIKVKVENSATRSFIGLIVGKVNGTLRFINSSGSIDGGGVGVAKLTIYGQTDKVDIEGDTYIGGIAGYARTVLTDTSTGHIEIVLDEINIKEDNNNEAITGVISNSSLYGRVGGAYGYVGGGKIINTYVNDGRIQGTSIAIGGVVGYAEDTVIEYTTSSTFDDDNVNLFLLHGTAQVGGIVGYGKYINVKNAKVYVDQLILDSSELVDLYASGVVGYLEGDKSHISNLENIHISINIISSNGHKIGGVLGYGKGVNIYEASSEYQNETISTSDAESVYGIANILADTKENYNWSSINAVLMDFTSSTTYNAQKFNTLLYMAVVDISNITGLDTGYKQNYIGSPNCFNETIYYKDYMTSDYFIRSDGYIEYYTMARVFHEAGLWSIGELSTGSGLKSLKFSKNMHIRAQSLVSSSYTINGTSQTYEGFYAAVTKRYKPNMEPINVVLSVSVDENDAYTKAIDNVNCIMQPIGTALFPINNITINGTGNPVINIKPDKTKLASGTSEKNVSNLYGLIGYVEGSISISNIKLSSSGETVSLAESIFPSVDNGVNKYYGSFIALGSPKYRNVNSWNSFANLSGFSIELNNVTNEININVTNEDNIAYLFKSVGGIIGEFGNTVVNNAGVEYTPINDSYAYSYDIYLGNVCNKGSIINKNTVDPNTFTGGIVGLIGLDNEHSAYKYNVIINDDINNAGDIEDNNIAAGVFGNVGKYTTITYHDSHLIILNTGDITATNIAANIIGSLSIKKKTELKYLHGGKLENDESLADGEDPYDIYVAKGTQNKLTATAENNAVISGLVGRLFVHANNIDYLTFVNSVNATHIESSNASSKISAMIGVYENVANNKIEKLVFDNCVNLGNIVNENTEALGAFISGQTAMPLERIEFNDCVNAGDVKALSIAGGFVGKLVNGEELVTFTNCQSEGSVIAKELSSAGGFVGATKQDVLIQASKDDYYEEGYAKSGKTIEASIAGGLVGQMLGNSLSGSIIYATNSNVEGISPLTYDVYTGKQSVSASTSGGAIGLFDSYTNGNSSVIIKNIVNQTNVSGSDVGGIVGEISVNNGGSPEKVAIKQCKNLGSVSSSLSAGGIIGYVEKSPKYLYVDDVELEGSITAAGNLGGIIGHLDSNQDITIDVGSITIDGATFSGSFTGGVVGSISTTESASVTINVSDISMENATLSAGICAGGVVGFVQSYGVNNIFVGSYSASNTTISSSASTPCVGGVIGYINNQGGDINITLSNIEFSGNISASESGCAGGVVGWILQSNGDLSIENSVLNISGTISGGFAGNVIGLLNNGNGTSEFEAITITSTGDSHNVSGSDAAGGVVGKVTGEGDVIFTNIRVLNIHSIQSDDCAGGIVGNICSPEPEFNVITISGAGNIKTNNTDSYAGGIVGAYTYGLTSGSGLTFDNCGVEASSSVTDGLAGLVGDLGGVGGHDVEITSCSITNIKPVYIGTWKWSKDGDGNLSGDKINGALIIEMVQDETNQDLVYYDETTMKFPEPEPESPVTE